MIEQRRRVEGGAARDLILEVAAPAQIPPRETRRQPRLADEQAAPGAHHRVAARQRAVEIDAENRFLARHRARLHHDTARNSTSPSRQPSQPCSWLSRAAGSAMRSCVTTTSVASPRGSNRTVTRSTACSGGGVPPGWIVPADNSHE